MNSEPLSTKATDKELKVLDGQVRYCALCNSRYIRSRGSIYKLNVRVHGKQKNLQFCSYTCYRKIQVLKENKDYEEIDKIFSEDKKENY